MKKYIQEDFEIGLKQYERGEIVAAEEVLKQIKCRTQSDEISLQVEDKEVCEEYEIPADLMLEMYELAKKSIKEGRCTPHSEIDSWVKERMGWK
ncbi:hypothetical protein D0T50_02705 [Bacteroides sp. 214]|uniref:hypothetical protein n=1 Tax=Bacteroides sp. 214 TaxID=2302935 RepID=UPI0013D53F22|nr:hypothetical protein [Bacteroides sp. 214]NDW11798.1 hypothetical protein [Bacteroides sp. 214]